MSCTRTNCRETRPWPRSEPGGRSPGQIPRSWKDWPSGNGSWKLRSDNSGIMIGSCSSRQSEWHFHTFHPTHFDENKAARKRYSLFSTITFRKKGYGVYDLTVNLGSCETDLCCAVEFYTHPLNMLAGVCQLSGLTRPMR